MPAAVGVTASLTGGFTPTAGHIANVSRDTSIGHAELKDESGDVVRLLPLKLKTSNITVSGQGTVALATAVVAGAITQGVAKLLSAKQTETPDGFPEFEASLVLYDEV